MKLITTSAHMMQQVNVEVPEVLCVPSCTIILCNWNVHTSVPSSLLQIVTKRVILRGKHFCKNTKKKKSWHVTILPFRNTKSKGASLTSHRVLFKLPI